jgi:hypothetical protein
MVPHLSDPQCDLDDSLFTGSVLKLDIIGLVIVRLKKQLTCRYIAKLYLPNLIIRSSISICNLPTNFFLSHNKSFRIKLSFYPHYCSILLYRFLFYSHKLLTTFSYNFIFFTPFCYPERFTLIFRSTCSSHHSSHYRPLFFDHRHSCGHYFGTSSYHIQSVHSQYFSVRRGKKSKPRNH